MLTQQSAAESKSSRMLFPTAIFEQILKPFGKNLLLSLILILSPVWRILGGSNQRVSDTKQQQQRQSDRHRGHRETKDSLITASSRETTATTTSKELEGSTTRKSGGGEEGTGRTSSSGRLPPRLPNQIKNGGTNQVQCSTISAASTTGTEKGINPLESQRTVHRGNGYYGGVKANVTSDSIIIGGGVRRNRSSSSSQNNRQNMVCVSTRSVPSSSGPAATAAGLQNQFLKLLHTAIGRREANSVKNLLNNAKKGEGLDVSLATFVDSQGYTLAHAAISAKVPEILTAVMEAIMSDASKQKFVESTGELPNKYSPLHLAALKDNIQGAHTLLRQNANPNSRSKLGTTPLHLAVMSGNPVMVDLLISNGAEPDAISQLGNTPLIAAVKKRSVELVKILLEAGANPRQIVENGSSARAAALEINAVDILGLIDGSSAVKRAAKGKEELTALRLTSL